MYRVFISYSHSDNFFAFNMKDLLNVEGRLSVFVDEFAVKVGAPVVETIVHLLAPGRMLRDHMRLRTWMRFVR